MREDHLFYTTGKGLSSSKDDSKHTFVTQGKTAGKRLREKPGASVKNQIALRRHTCRLRALVLRNNEF